MHFKLTQKFCIRVVSFRKPPVLCRTDVPTTVSIRSGECEIVFFLTEAVHIDYTADESKRYTYKLHHSLSKAKTTSTGPLYMANRW